MSKRTQRLLKKAADDYQAEIRRAHEKQMADSLKFPGGSFGCDGLTTMAGAAVLGVYNGKGGGLSLTVQRPALIALAATVARIACGVSSIVTWIYVEDQLPDADTNVLVAAEGDDVFWPGYLGEEDKWLTPEGLPFTSRVYAWAYFPTMPPKKGEG
jgi:hypothetical protein